MRQCAVVTNSQAVVHGVWRYWTRGIAVVQQVSGAGADCMVRGMSVVKALRLICCMCVRASYMKLTIDTHLMQQFIYYYK